MLNFGYKGFCDRSLRIWSQIFKIHDGRSNMAVKIYKKGQIDAKYWLYGFLGSLITNLKSDFQNSQWRIQYVGLNLQKKAI